MVFWAQRPAAHHTNLLQQKEACAACWLWHQQLAEGMAKSGYIIVNVKAFFRVLHN